jgi:hypothetical protein
MSHNTCYEQCNNRECAHNNNRCNRAAKFDACTTAQSSAGTITAIPVHFDTEHLTTSTDNSDGAAVRAATLQRPPYPTSCDPTATTWTWTWVPTAWVPTPAHRPPRRSASCYI